MSNPMNLTIPTPNTTPGPTYAANVSDALTTIASHTHVTGEGNPVPTAGLDIDADLTFGGFSATHLKSTQFASQGSPLSSSFLSCLYVSGGELYYNDGNGTSIQFTVGGVFNAALVGAFTNLANTSGAATYDSVSGTFTFTSNTGVKATLAIGPLKIADTASGALSITLKSPTGLVSAYTLTLPGALPAANTLAQVADDGTMTFGPTAPASVSRVHMYPAGTITAPIGWAKSASPTSNFDGTSTTFAAITNASISSFAASGRPVWIGFAPDTSAGKLPAISLTGATSTGSISLQAQIKIAVTGSATEDLLVFTGNAKAVTTSTNANQVAWPPSAVGCIYYPSAGTYSFAAEYLIGSNATDLFVTDCFLVAYEI